MKKELIAEEAVSAMNEYGAFYNAMQEMFEGDLIKMYLLRKLHTLSQAYLSSMIEACQSGCSMDELICHK